MRLHLGLRAIVSVPLGLFITFFQAHGPDIGLIMLAAFSGAMAAGNLAFLISRQLSKPDAISTLGYLPVLLVSLFALLQPEELYLPLFVNGVVILGLFTAAFEGYRAKTMGLSSRDGRDLLISALMAVALGLMFLVATLDSVSAVGFFGAYLILFGVHWGIASATPASK